MKQLKDTDKVLWESEDGMESVFVTVHGSIGINVPARVTVMPPKDWCNSLDELDRYRVALGEARARISKLEGYISDMVINRMEQ